MANGETTEVELKDQVIAIKRVTKVVKGGKNLSFSALVVVGDQKGRVGYGLGKAKEVPSAIRKGLEVLKRGEILVISPEGTRSHDGVLQPAHPGVILLALHSAAPLLPIAYHGAENWHEMLFGLRRADFHIRVGKLFQLVTHGEKMTHGVRQQMLDELMHQLAGLLPHEFRGKYAGLPAKSSSYLTYVN